MHGLALNCGMTVTWLGSTASASTVGTVDSTSGHLDYSLGKSTYLPSILIYIKPKGKSPGWTSVRRLNRGANGEAGDGTFPDIGWGPSRP